MSVFCLACVCDVGDGTRTLMLGTFFTTEVHLQPSAICFNGKLTLFSTPYFPSKVNLSPFLYLLSLFPQRFAVLGLAGATL